MHRVGFNLEQDQDFSMIDLSFQDHVNFVIGRQSFNLGNLDDAQMSLKYLLLYESCQPPSQQASHLREFLAVFKVCITLLGEKSANNKFTQPLVA